MRKYALYLLLLSASLMLSQRSPAQTKLTPEQAQDKMVANKIYHPFPLTQKYRAINGKTFDFAAHERPVFLYVGQAACVICTFELPVYLDLCRRFPEIDFVYLSPDDTAAILKKFGKALQQENLIVLPVSPHLLWDKDIARVYPVKYFIRQNGIVQDAASGEVLKDRKEIRENWRTRLKALQVKKQ